MNSLLLALKWLVMATLHEWSLTGLEVTSDCYSFMNSLLLALKWLVIATPS